MPLPARALVLTSAVFLACTGSVPGDADVASLSSALKARDDDKDRNGEKGRHHDDHDDDDLCNACAKFCSLPPPQDAGMPDAGTLDAGVADAGTPDAGGPVVCLPGTVNCDGLAADGCECPGTGCCSAGSCQVSHDNGVNAVFYDCQPRGTPGQPATYSQSLAQEAAMSWDAAGTIFPVACPSGGATSSCVANQASGGCAVWCYSGPAAGYVAPPSSSCFCPGTTDHIWF